MSILYRQKDFTESLPLLVLNEPCWLHSTHRAGLADSALAGILTHCRMALKHARDCGFPVAFVGSTARGSRWISQLEPARTDMLFERRAASIYSSLYFHEATKHMRRLVLAGLFRRGCARTIADGLVAGHELLFLRDAIEMSEEEHGFWFSGLSPAEPVTELPVGICTTAQWISATCGISAAGRSKIVSEGDEA